MNLKIVAQPAEFVAQKAVVARRVMGHHDTAVGNFQNPLGDLKKLGRRPQHGVVDAGKFHHKRLDGDFRVDQADELIGYLVSVKAVNRNFGDAFFIKSASGGFYVENCVQSNFFLAVTKYAAANPHHIAAAGNSQLVVARHAHRENVHVRIISPRLVINGF